MRYSQKELYILHNLKMPQQQIAKDLGMTQGNVSHCLEYLHKKVPLIEELDEMGYDRDELPSLILGMKFTAAAKKVHLLKVLDDYYHTVNQIETGSKMRMSQSSVLFQINRFRNYLITKYPKNPLDFKYIKIFDFLQKHQDILKKHYYYRPGRSKDPQRQHMLNSHKIKLQRIENEMGNKVGV